jgi:hypothetical protein
MVVNFSANAQADKNPSVVAKPYVDAQTSHDQPYVKALRTLQLVTTALSFVGHSATLEHGTLTLMAIILKALQSNVFDV